MWDERFERMLANEFPDEWMNLFGAGVVNELTFRAILHDWKLWQAGLVDDFGASRMMNGVLITTYKHEPNSQGLTAATQLIKLVGKLFSSTHIL